MKRINARGFWAGLATACVILAQSASSLRADLVIDSFKDSIGSWTATWGSSPVLTFDSDDAKGSASSGSLLVTANYFTPEDNGWEQLVITRNFASPVVGANYTSVSIDVKVDATSVPTDAGQYGYFELKRTDGTSLGGLNLTSKDWTTVSFPISPVEGTLTGIIIQNGNGGFKGPIALKLDNLIFHAPPVPQTVIDTFPDEDSTHRWTATWGSSPVLAFDTDDAGGAGDSGSLKVTADYFTPEDNGWEQLVITRTFESPVVGADHVSVSIDVKVDPSSVPATDGTYGYFELKRLDGTAMGGVSLKSTEWTTITFPIAPTEGNLTGIIIQTGNGGFQGPIILYLDNFVFTQRSGEVKAPTLAIEPNRIPGLKLIASAPGQAYQRQNIVYVPSENLENSLWWVNQGGTPITYSVTWGDFPSASDEHGDFQGHIMLVKDSGKAITPDWNDANVVMIEFQYTKVTDTKWEARARFLHKVNEPAANGMLYRTADHAADGPVGVLGEVRSPSMLGTWSITFKNDTDVTLTAPNGATKDISIPVDEASSYEPSSSGVSALFGIQPNKDSRVGLSAVIQNIKITKGSDVVVDESFTSPDLNPDVWVVRAQDGAGVFALPAEIDFLVSWNLPDPGFSLLASPSLTGPWAATPDPTLVGARRIVKIEHAALPGAKAGYFRLLQSANPQ